MIKDCPKCRRKKVLMGMGAMIVTCPECKGVGHVKVDNVDAKVDKDADVTLFDDDFYVEPVERTIKDAPVAGNVHREVIYDAVAKVARVKRPYNRKAK